MQHLRAVIWRLQEAGLTVKPRKCQLAMTKYVYLGHIVEEGQVEPSNSLSIIRWKVARAPCNPNGILLN